MTRKYFDLCEDLHVPGRWLLGELHHGNRAKVDGCYFINGAPIDFDGTLQVAIYRPGVPLDYSHMVGAPAPVVSSRVAEALIDLAGDDIQLIQVRVESHAGKYYLVNARRTVKCIDDATSAEVHYWLPEDGRPDKLGGYRAVHGMRVNPDLIASNIRIFRPQGWTVALLASEEIRIAMERLGATGVKFKPV